MARSSRNPEPAMRLSSCFHPRFLLLLLLLATVLGLAGCDTVEERAEKHYERGMALLEEGDTERALLEFRNVFRLDNAHVPALSQYAALLDAQGDIQGAAKHYLRVVELDPQNSGAHRHLAEILVTLQDFGEAEIHASEALRHKPEDPLARGLKAMLDYRKDQDRPGAVARAEAVIAEAPEIVAAHMVLIADRLSAEDLDAALARTDAALAVVPGDEGLHLARLSILEKQGETEAIGEQLTRMVGLFPENAGVREALIQWHLRAGDINAAEAVVRAGGTAGDPQATLDVVQFLYEWRGAEAASAELERLAAGAEDSVPYLRVLAEINFTEGRKDKAIAALRALLAEATPSEETRGIQVMLAGMLADTGAAKESAALVKTVLAEEPGHPDALKLRARAEIAAGDPDAAIRDMRLALTRAPEDPEIMTIMALAYERAGNRDLMGERLALAVEVSKNGVAESLSYASYLMQENRPGPAKDILGDALRRAPDSLDLWHMLGRIALFEDDWREAIRIMDRLRADGSPEAMALAASLETESLEAWDETGLLAGLLADMTRAGGAESDLAREVIPDLARGEVTAARLYLDELLQGDPANVPAYLLLGSIHAAENKTVQAEALYRDAIAAVPEDARAYEALVNLLSSQGQEAEAAAVAVEGLEAAGPTPHLQFALAGFAEAHGDIPRAVALYEAVHQADPGNLVAANNLASLLTTGVAANPADRSAAEAARLEQAVGIAQNLKEVGLPPLQDTYGWILFLQGEASAAYSYLEPAARGLPDNAQAQYHWAEAAHALEDWDTAKAAFGRALELHAAGNSLPQAEIARVRLAEIEARRGAAPGEPGE
jgi:cellulose synthase operon protein C